MAKERTSIIGKAKPPAKSRSTKRPVARGGPRSLARDTVAFVKHVGTIEARAQSEPHHDKRKSRVKMSDALRGAGMDEHKFAQDFRELAARVNTKGKEKMQLEVLKEWSKQLDGSPALRSASSQEPVPVQYITKVPNPVRDTPTRLPMEPDSPADDSARDQTAKSDDPSKD